MKNSIAKMIFDTIDERRQESQSPEERHKNSQLSEASAQSSAYQPMNTSEMQ
jgi:hypothetical protein